MKIKQILIVNDAIRSLVELDRSKDLKLAGSVRIKFATNLLNLLKHINIYTEEKNALIKELGTKQDGSETMEIKADSPNMPEFTKQHNEILELDRLVNLEKVSEQQLFNPNGDRENQIPMDILAVLLENELVTK